MFWNGETVAVAGALASPGNLRNGGASPVSLQISSAPLKLGFQGVLSGHGPRRTVGAIDIKAPSARRLFAWLGMRRWGLGGGGPLSFSGRIDAARDKIALTEVAIALDNAAARGSLAVERGRRPALSGEFEVTNLDLVPYLGPWAAVSSEGASPASASASAPASPSAHNAPTQQPAVSHALASSLRQPADAAAPAAVSRWSEARFHFAPLKRLDAALKLRTNALRWGDFRLDKATIDLRLTGGRLQLDFREMALYGGTGAGAVTVDAGVTPPAMGGRADLHTVTVQPLLRDLAEVDQLTGSGDVSVALAGNGASLNELVGLLAGSTSIGLSHGTIGGAGFAKFLRGVAGPVADKYLSRPFDFDTVTATGTIADGVLRNNDLKLSSPKVSATGEGSADLKRRQLDYAAELSNADFAARIAITGPWDNPSCQVQSVRISPGALRRGKLRDLLRRGG